MSPFHRLRYSSLAYIFCSNFLLIDPPTFSLLPEASQILQSFYTPEIKKSGGQGESYSLYGFGSKLTNETDAQIKSESKKVIDNEPLFASYYITLTPR
jgi:hypothetical protein